MAVSSSTSATGSSLDVAGIVSQLMEVENRPLTKIDNKIGASTLKISTLGVFKSQLSNVQSALRDLQTPSNFTAWSAKFNTESIATAELSTNAAAGIYQLEISQLARPNIWNVSGFASESDAMIWFNAAGQTNIKNSADATVLKSDSGQYVLSLKAKRTGTSASFSVDSSSLTLAASGFAGLSAAEFQTSRNAQFTLNGVTFTRATNSVSDALTGVTLNLTALTSAPVTLTVNNQLAIV